MVIECNNEKSQTCLKKQIEEKLTDEVNIIDSTIINKNNIKIVNINKDMHEKNDDEIITILKKQNEISNNDLNIKKKKRIIFKNRENWSMILEINHMTHLQLLEKGIIYLGWQRCKNL